MVPFRLPRFALRGAAAVLGALALGAPAAAAPAASGAPPRWTVRAGASLLDFTGDSAVREYAVPGTRIGLTGSPGLGFPGGAASVAVHRRLGRFRLGLTGEYRREHGSGTTGAGFNFNGGTYPAGRDLATTLEAWRVRLDLSYPLLRAPGGELRVLGGLEYYHPILTLVATPAVDTHDRHEDFLQFLPLPVAGLEGSRRVGPGFTLRAGLRAGTAGNWNTHRSEGGPMRMDLTLAEADLGLERTLSRSVGVEVGYSFRYADGNLESGEDGNRIRTREHGLGLALLWHGR